MSETRPIEPAYRYTERPCACGAWRNEHPTAVCGTWWPLVPKREAEVIAKQRSDLAHMEYQAGYIKRLEAERGRLREALRAPDDEGSE